jgi:hypothetical protein
MSLVYLLCHCLLFAGAYKPVQLEGWVFYPGLDAAAEDDKPPEGGWDTLQQLAEKCSSKGGTGHGPESPMPPTVLLHASLH